MPVACTRPRLSVAAAAALLLFIVLHFTWLQGPAKVGECTDRGIVFHGFERSTFRGGHEGSCWCGKADGYCLCTPSLSVDVIVETCHKGQLAMVFVQRKSSPFGLAIPGGFVDLGESCEDAAVREVREELQVEISNLQQVVIMSANLLAAPATSKQTSKYQKQKKTQ